MEPSGNSLRRAGLVCALLGAAVSALGFTYFYKSETNGLPMKWPPGVIPLRIMLGDSPTLSDGTNYNTTFQAAMQLWQAQLGSVSFQTTITTGTGSDHNEVNEVFFASSIFGRAFEGSTLAYSTYWRTGIRITESDIIFNSQYTFDSYRGPVRTNFDMQRIALHELGHTLGLDHPNDAGQSVPAIMNNPIRNQDGLAADDIAGAQSLYGPSGVPSNDGFANATVLTLAAGNVVSLTAYNTNGTKEAGEPNHAGNAGGRSVWFKWTAPANGEATLDTRESYFDTVLAVYTGSALANMSSVAANDDITPGTIPASKVTFYARSGTTYLFAVDGRNGDSAGLKLNLSLDPNAIAPPLITTQPANVSVNSGGNASFSVVATGPEPLAYQWFFNTNTIPGATNASYSLTGVTAAQGGTYAVTITNPGGSVTSDNVTLTLNAPPPAPPPSSGGGGGGGGAPSLWFCAVLAALGVARLLNSRNLRPET